MVPPGRILAGLWRIRLPYALGIALPLQLLVVAVLWQGHDAFSSYQRYVEAEHTAGRGEPMPAFDLEQWRYFARDSVRRGLHGILTFSAPSGDDLETFHLRIGGDSLQLLDADLPASGKRSFHDAALLTPDGGVLEVKARYMGDNHWHWLYPQKSWRIKVAGGDSWRDRRAFNLKNAPSMLTIDEPVVTQLARDLDVLAPDVHPVKLFVNDGYAGLYLFWDLSDESLLRRARRMPGSIYSGDGAPADPGDGVSLLFRDATRWQKDAERNAERAGDRSEIDRLIAVLVAEDPARFFAFAERHIDLQRFARYIAIDRAFGTIHHDYHHNHKLYFDPYCGRFEPILWDLNDWMLELRADRFDAALNPLLIALRSIPQYELLLQRTLHTHLDDALRPERVAALLAEWEGRSRSARTADRGRDTRSHEAGLLRLPLPHSEHYSMDEYDAALERTQREYAARHGRLRSMLDDSWLVCSTSSGDGPAVLDLTSGGRVAQHWTGLTLPGVLSPVALHADRNDDGVLDPGDPEVARAEPVDGAVRLLLDEILYPGLERLPLRGAFPLLYGRIDLAPTPLSYRYFLVGVETLPEQLELTASNAVTGAPLVVPATDGAVKVMATGPLHSGHPWTLPAPPPPREVVYGPGEVVLEHTTIHDATTRVRILPGTVVRLAPEVSLLCRGPLSCEGTPDAPIALLPRDAGRPWGTFALQGQGTAGSRIAHCTFDGGSSADLELLQLTGMVNVADTRDIVIEHCTFGSNRRSDDALHWAYVRDAEVRDCRFRGAPSDAFDLDICEAVTVRRCVFTGAGNDALDFMTSRATVQECRFLQSGDKGISAGEGSTVDVRDCTFDACRMGIQVKDASLVRADRLEMIGCGTGVDLRRKNLRYSKGGTLQADAISMRGGGEPLAAGERCHHNVAEIFVDGERVHP